MEKLDSKRVKSEIVHFLRNRGPSLPIQVARAIKIETLFTSAFLSEMLSEGTIKISHLKVGGSPLYYLPETLNLLENFSQHLNSKEKEAFELLKKNRFVEDTEQPPAIRVALRSLRDFAFPLNKDNKVYWRYFLVNEENFKIPKREAEILGETRAEEIKEPKINKEENTNEITEENPKLKEIKEELLRKEQELKKAVEELEKLKTSSQLHPLLRNRKKTLKKVEKENTDFLDKVKNVIQKQEFTIINIEHADKKQVILKVHKENKESLVFALNKKRVEEEDLIKSYRKALQSGLPYFIIAIGELSKKTKEAIEAHQKFKGVIKLENSQEKENNKL
jgi:hypothetical protein